MHVVDKNNKSMDPISFYRDWNNPVPEEQEKWRSSILDELQNMKNRGVWKVIKDEGKKKVGLKWVFNTKICGRKRSRIVALGYLQRPGIDYEFVYAPVINDSVFRIMLVVCLIFKWELNIVDIESAFLEADAIGNTYVKLPSGV